MHAPLFLDTNYNYLASAHPLGDRLGALALSDVLLLSDGFEIRDVGNNVTTSNGELRNNAILASYAHKMFGQSFSAGATTKFIQQKIEGYSDSTLGLDLGFIYKPSRFFNAGITFTNVNSPAIKLNTEDDVFRPATRVGLASHVYKDKLTLTVDATKLNKQKALYAAGAEFSPHKLMALRAGFNANRSYTFGIGIKLAPFSVDYAFSDSDVGAFNKVSLTWAWHNIYKTEIEPPIKEGRAVYPLAGFDNQVAFKTMVPNRVVARWNLAITNAEGKLVRNLNGDLKPPEVINWDARNDLGEPMGDGQYRYQFTVDYKNGKSWNINGDIQLDLPDHQLEEVIDMNLELNGSETAEE